MSVLTIRNIDQELDRSIREQAKKQGKSLNSLVLESLREKLLSNPSKPGSHHDLDHLAGTWSEKDHASFQKAIRAFESIDTDIWK